LGGDLVLIQEFFFTDAFTDVYSITSFLQTFARWRRQSFAEVYALRVLSSCCQFSHRQTVCCNKFISTDS